jgi:hypothetical protein
MIRSYAGYVSHELLKQDIEEIIPQEVKVKKSEKGKKTKGSDK